MKIPPGISCLERRLEFCRNSISRLVADDSLCFTILQVLPVSHNNITYIYDEAFFLSISLWRLTLGIVYFSWTFTSINFVICCTDAESTNAKYQSTCHQRYFSSLVYLRILRIANWRPGTTLWSSLWFNKHETHPAYSEPDDESSSAEEIDNFRQTTRISRTKPPNLNVYCPVL